MHLQSRIMRNKSLTLDEDLIHKSQAVRCTRPMNQTEFREICETLGLLFHSLIPIVKAYFLHHDKIKISSTALYIVESLSKALNPQICGHVCYMFQVTLGQVRNIKIRTWCLQRYLHAMVSPWIVEISNCILDCSDKELSSGRSAQSGNTAISCSVFGIMCYVRTFQNQA